MATAETAEVTVPVPDPQEGLEQLHALIPSSEQEVITNHADSDVRWKQFRFKVESVEADGTCKGYASVWGVLDSDDEIVDKGATLRSIKNNPNFIMLWQHDTRNPIGFAIEPKEDDYGLKLTFRLALDCEQGRTAYSLLKLAKEIGGTAKMGLSIGFRALQKKFVEDPKTKKTVLHFTEIQILETSVVTFPANPAAWITEVKSKFLAGIEDKALSAVTVPTPPSGENPPGEKSMSKAAQTTCDFDQALAQQQKRRELSKFRSDIEDALYTTLNDVHNSDHDEETKKGLIRETYEKHAKAMGDWHVRSYFGDSAKAFAGDLLKKEAATTPTSEAHVKADQSGTDLELKSGKGKVSAAMTERLKHAVSLHETACDMHGKAMKIIKDAYGDDSVPTVAGSGGTEMMSGDPAIEAKEKTTDADTKSAITTQNERTTSEDLSDSGIHSLVEEMAQFTKSRLKDINHA